MRRVYALNGNRERVAIGHTVKLASGRYRAYSYTNGDGWEVESYSVARMLIERAAPMWARCQTTR